MIYCPPRTRPASQPGRWAGVNAFECCQHGAAAAYAPISIALNDWPAIPSLDQWIRADAADQQQGQEDRLHSPGIDPPTGARHSAWITMRLPSRVYSTLSQYFMDGNDEQPVAAKARTIKAASVFMGKPSNSVQSVGRLLAISSHRPMLWRYRAEWQWL